MSTVTPPFVTLVTGAPRSGTSMMMKMLEAGGIEALTDRARGADVDNPGGYYELEAVKTTKEDASWVDEARGRAVKLVYALVRDLPIDRTYRVLIMRRDLGEVIASQKKMLERLGRDPHGLPEDRVKEMFRTHLEATEAWLAKYPGFKTLRVEYADVLGDTNAACDRIAAFLDCGLDAAAMAAIVDPSLYRNRSA